MGAPGAAPALGPQGSAPAGYQAKPQSPMSKLTHILKVILLGPQPKDELYEEWSKDPLAEWFREQRRLSTWLKRPDALKSVIGEYFLALLPAIVMILCLIYGVGWWIWPIGAIMVVYGLLYLSWQRTESRPHSAIPAKVVDMLWPTKRAGLLVEMWMTGLKGRDVLKSIFLEKRRMEAIVGYIAASILLLSVLLWWLVGWSILTYFLVYSIMFWLTQQVMTFSIITSRNPFINIGGRIGPVNSNPGIRSIQGKVFTKGEVPGRIVPMKHVIAIAVIFVLTVCLAVAEILPPWTFVAAFALPIASLLGYIHWFGRRTPTYDRDMLEDAFLEADRDFDQWVRTELIGDEDALR
jgi:hypothetical protein